MMNSYPIVSQNIEGRYYVDESCIYCGLCVEMTPDNFDYDKIEEFAYIKKQPDCDVEHRLLAETIEICPLESIGDKLRSNEELMDNLGLGNGTTPKSLSGGIAQIVARWFKGQ